MPTLVVRLLPKLIEPQRMLATTSTNGSTVLTKTSPYLRRAMVQLTRRVTFNAAHKLFVASWSDEQNRAAFGKCANANWHGHNYEMFVTVSGRPHPLTGFVIDAKALGELIKAEVVDDLDHANLNLDVPWLEGCQPTSENIVMAIWRRLSPKLSTYAQQHDLEAKLHRIRLVETENIFVDYYGD